MGIAIIAFFVTREIPLYKKIIRSEQTTDVRTGALVVSEEGVPYFATQLEEQQPVLIEVAFDALSTCATQETAQPCSTLTVEQQNAFGGVPLMVEGTLQDDVLLVRKLQILREGEVPRAPAVGSVFISWTDAVELLTRCEVRGVTQTHALDVYLELPDGSSVRAVEPAIDEVFAVQAATSCPQFPVATE